MVTVVFPTQSNDEKDYYQFKSILPELKRLPGEQGKYFSARRRTQSINAFDQVEEVLKEFADSTVELVHTQKAGQGKALHISTLRRIVTAVRGPNVYIDPDALASIGAPKWFEEGAGRDVQVSEPEARVSPASLRHVENNEAPAPLLRCTRAGAAKVTNSRGDVMIDMTQLCAQHGKMWANLKRHRAVRYTMTRLCEELRCDASDIELIVTRGMNPGTWVHPRLLSVCGFLFSDQFRLSASRWVEEWKDTRSDNAGEWARVLRDKAWTSCVRREAVVRDRLAAREDGQTEVATTHGRYADVVTDTQVIEVKHASGATDAMGQVLDCAVDWPHLRPRVHIFGTETELNGLHMERLATLHAKHGVALTTEVVDDEDECEGEDEDEGEGEDLRSSDPRTTTESAAGSAAFCEQPSVDDQIKLTRAQTDAQTKRQAVECVTASIAKATDPKVIAALTETLKTIMV